ncbi:amino acid transporter [Xylariaceae sp. FL0804]|nr:amino acid transporter [Xylariaceae sp. FL0804]
MDGHASSMEESDKARLALLGKKQVLKRRFSFLSMFGFAVCELITWETVLSIFYEAFDNGGPAGALYGFIIAWASTLSVYTVISELASLAPIAGGQYYWVYILAPARYKTVLSYVVGWLTSLAWIATVATETLFAGTIIQGIIALDQPDYTYARWQGTLLTWAVICGCVFVNVVIPAWLPRFEVFILVFHIAGFVAIVATLWALTPHYSDASTVWASSLNTGGWPSQGLSYCVGFLGNVATFVGADASVHLAEEVSNPALNIPRAIIGAMCINGAVGLVMMITILYCLGDIDKVLNTNTGFPFIQVFADSVANVAGATVMTVVVLLLVWACALGITTTASRMIWSFARDNGLPASKYLSRVSTRTRVPVAACLAATLIAALLTLIYIGSATAFNDVISLTITGFYGSYFIPVSLLLYHRIRGNILPYGTEPEPEPNAGGAVGKADIQSLGQAALARDGLPKEETSKDPGPGTEHADFERGTVVVQARLIWGPWRVPGVLGILNNLYACIYMIFVIFWSVWPADYKVSASSMNYSIVVTGGVMILSTVWYFVRARKVYRGPTVDEEVERLVGHGRVGSVS